MSEDRSTPVTARALISEPFYAVDTALGLWLLRAYSGNQTKYRLTWRRVAFADGWCRHIVAAPDRTEIMVFELRAISADRTRISIVMPNDATVTQTDLEERLSIFWGVFQKMQQEADQLPRIEDLPASQATIEELLARTPTSTGSRGGRASWPEDIRAREQLAANVDQEVVFEEWKKRLSRKRTRPANFKDTFRKNVIEYQKRKKPNQTSEENSW